jgi:virulence-associated protein VapD
MRERREDASATVLNGNVNIMKQEGIRTKWIAKCMHDVEVMYVRQHANVITVIVIRSLKNGPLSFAMLLRI